MPYTIDWIIERRVILLNVQGAISVSELESLIQDYEIWIDSGVSPVHAVIDVTRIEDYPKNVQEIRKLLPKLDEDQVGWVMLVNRNLFINLISSILLRLNRVQFRAFQNHEACLSFLYSRDPSLVQLAEAESA